MNIFNLQVNAVFHHYWTDLIWIQIGSLTTSDMFVMYMYLQEWGQQVPIQTHNPLLVRSRYFRLIENLVLEKPTSCLSWKSTLDENVGNLCECNMVFCVSCIKYQDIVFTICFLLAHGSSPASYRSPLWKCTTLQLNLWE